MGLKTIEEGLRTERDATLGKTIREGGSVKDVRNLVREGASANADLGNGVSPLHAAVTQGNQKVVDQLVSMNADPYAQTANGYTPLHYASGATATAQVLGAQRKRDGIDVNARTADGNTPLHLAASAGDAARCGLLVSLGANVEAVNQQERTALHEAVSAFDPDAVRVLLEAGANPNAPDMNGMSPLSYGVLYNGEHEARKECVKALVLAGGNPDQRDNDGNTPREFSVVKCDFIILNVMNKADLQRGNERKTKHAEMEI